MKRALVVGAAAPLSLTTLHAVTPEPVEAAFPGTNGLIAYADGGIRVVEPDGTGKMRLTFNGSDGAPAWSPDGTKIAFHRNGDIWVMNADGTGQVRVTTHSGSEARPAWSPDGAKIIFDSDRTGHREIWRVNYPQPYGNAVRITHTPKDDLVAYVQSYNPRWSPRGDWIAFNTSHHVESYYVTYTIAMVKPDGTSLVEVPGGDNFAPDWNPAGTRLVYSTALDFYLGEGPYDLETINPFASNPRDTVQNLTNTGWDWEDRYFSPTWSPDGRWLATVREYDYWGSGSGSGLYILRSDGSGPQVKIVDAGLSSDPDWQPRPTDGGGNGDGRDCTITGTPGPDEIVGTWRDDVICGLEGNDVIRGKGGNDTIYGHQGADIVYGGNGNDHIHGGAGNDRLAGEAGNDTVDGGPGKDKLFGNADNDTLLAKDYWKDTVYGGPGQDNATIDHGKDTVYSVETIH